MPAPANAFKAALRAGRTQIGLWVAMGDPYAAALAGEAGFDWLVVDGEHGPNDLRSILAQLQALEASPASAVVRPPMGEPWMLKQLLDTGAQTLLVPMVESAAEAEALVRAVRYPPRGIRGMGASIARASRYGTISDYARNADDEVCLLVQAESRRALAGIAEIAAVEGVDGVFIGPADLAADMGFAGRLDAPEVQETIERGIAAIVEAGKPAGILTFDERLNRRYLSLGVTFLAVGADVFEYSAALARLRRRYSGAAGETAEGSGSASGY